MAPSLEGLTTRLDALLDDLARARSEHADAIASVAEGNRAGAENLVSYTTLRRHDRRQLQNDLLDIGATSLATTEANVSAKVHAARNVLGALRGDPGPWHLDAIDQALDLGDEILDAHARQLFGPMRAGRPTRIMVTLPSEAADEPSLVEAMVQAGMDVARINCAHDGPPAWSRMAAHVRSAADAAGRQVLISMDLPGPKLRTGEITDGPAVGRARVTRDDSGRVIAPARIWLRPRDTGTPPPTPAPPARRETLVVEVEPTWLSARHLGDHVSVPDARGRTRRFTVTLVEPGGVLLEGQHNTYVAAGASLSCHGEEAEAAGIPPTPRRLMLVAGDPLILTGDH
ncbi:MAG: pyruvate kinase, partial [Lapillicoccus sp.]